MSVKRFFLFTLLTWILLVSASFAWNYSVASKEQERLAFESAKTFFEYINITRIWNTQHTGVYVPVTHSTHPNPYLNVPNRDIKVNESLTLTQINPAYMIKQISDIAMQKSGVQFHFTSLNPINPANKPSPLETKTLKEFQNGLKEKGQFITQNGQPYYFYMAPIHADESCFGCHPKQDLLHSNIGGGISITSSYMTRTPFLTLFIGHIIIGFIGVIVIMLTSRKLREAYKIIQQQATIDALTGIPNRRVFSERIVTEFKHHLRDKHPLSVIMCDIDKFKEFNDTYGHLAGDECLKQIAQLIQSTLKRPVDFCARYGGEEFIILLPETNQQGAHHFAEHLRQKIEKLNIPNKNVTPLPIVTISLGVATASSQSPVSSYEKLIHQADKALYKAKEQGRNQVQIFKRDPNT